MSDPRVKELFVRAQAEDRNAFARLCDAVEPQLRGFVRRLLGSSAAEDEIIQDSFFALYLNMERLDGIEHLRPFLFRVVRNLSYSELRKRGRYRVLSAERRPHEAESLATMLPDPRPLQDEALHWVLIGSAVRRAMNRLPENQRQSLILYAEEDLSYEEIAVVMNTDVGTVKSRLFYARKNLRRMLHPEILVALGIEQEAKGGQAEARRTGR